MKNKRKAFNIPAINNQREALAKHLGVNSDIESDFATIVVLDVSDGIHRFSHNDKTYLVTGQSSKLKSDAMVEFNSSFWAVKCETPSNNQNKY
tara:strand:- start:137 stop:415 length:279 start_codon:yes stop_codon:yes gene_type:complete